MTAKLTDFIRTLTKDDICQILTADPWELEYTDPWDLSAGKIDYKNKDFKLVPTSTLFETELELPIGIPCEALMAAIEVQQNDSGWDSGHLNSQPTAALKNVFVDLNSWSLFLLVRFDLDMTTVYENTAEFGTLDWPDEDADDYEEADAEIELENTQEKDSETVLLRVPLKSASLQEELEKTSELEYDAMLSCNKNFHFQFEIPKLFQQIQSVFPEIDRTYQQLVALLPILQAVAEAFSCTIEDIAPLLSKPQGQFFFQNFAAFQSAFQTTDDLVKFSTAFFTSKIVEQAAKNNLLASCSVTELQKLALPAAGKTTDAQIKL